MVDFLSEIQAMKDKFIELSKKRYYSIVHYAGHARFDPVNPDLSYLQFRTNGDSENLYASEISAKICFKILQ